MRFEQRPDAGELVARAKVCGECPFRRTAPAGWLGGNTPELYAQAATSDFSVACHMEWAKKDSGTPESKVERCRGALIMRQNQCKLPRHPAAKELARTIEHDDSIFANQWEFEKHHFEEGFNEV